MEYVYYKSKKGNFGDDLNAWLWPKFFGENNINDDYLIGIGSLLFKENKMLQTLGNKKKIVFGTGLKPAYTSFEIDNTWDIKFLRGPLSAGALGNKYEYITDAAYAVRLTDEFNKLSRQQKKYKISVIPYFHSVEYFNWEGICKQLGYHYISPLSECGVEHTLKEIASSEYIISEAMHGAILADALRIPWSRFVLTTPYTEGQMISEFKWMDWLYSVNVLVDKPVYVQFYRNSFMNRLIKALTHNKVDTKFLIKSMVKKDLLTVLPSITNYYLSKDETVRNIDERIQQKINEVTIKTELKN